MFVFAYNVKWIHSSMFWMILFSGIRRNFIATKSTEHKIFVSNGKKEREKDFYIDNIPEYGAKWLFYDIVQYETIENVYFVMTKMCVHWIRIFFLYWVHCIVVHLHNKNESNEKKNFHFHPLSTRIRVT